MNTRDPNLNLRQIRSFLELVEAGGFTRASRSLKVGQATVSHHVNQLEAMLGVRLVNRSSREFSVTRDGELFAAFCRRVVDGLEELRGGMAPDEVGGLVHLAASTIPAAYLLPGVLASLRLRHPGLVFRLSGGDSREVIDGVREGKVDVGIAGRIMKHPSLSYHALRGDEIVLIGTAGAPTRIAIGDLASLPIIVREAGSGTRRVTEEALQEKGLRPSVLNVVMECTSTDAIIESVAVGMGYSFVSRLAIGRYLDRGSLSVVGIRGLTIKRSFFLVKSNGREYSRPAAVTIDAVKEYCGVGD